MVNMWRMVTVHVIVECVCLCTIKIFSPPFPVLKAGHSVSYCSGAENLGGQGGA